MAQENVEIVRRVYEVFAHLVELWREGRDWEASPEWNDIYDPEVVLEEVAEIPDSDVYHGVEGIKRWFRAGIETFDDVKWEPREFLPHGPHVVVDVHGAFRGGSSGIGVELELHHVFTIRDARVVHLRGFLERAHALEAAGLRE